MISLFQKAFAQAKALGLNVAVTTEHSGPGFDDLKDALAYVNSWCQDDNIDIISPQLYGGNLHISRPDFSKSWAGHS